MLPFYKLKAGPIVLFFFAFYFQKYHSPCRKKMIFENKQNTTTTKTHFYKLKTGPIMLRNIFGPIFNLDLDQFLTYVFFAETPIFILFSAKMQNLKKHKKDKKTLL